MLSYVVPVAIGMVMIAMFLNLFRLIRGPELPDRVKRAHCRYSRSSFRQQVCRFSCRILKATFRVLRNRAKPMQPWKNVPKYSVPFSNRKDFRSSSIH